MRYTFCISILLILLCGCRSDDFPELISSVKGTAESVFLTRDHHNDPVVVWTEKENNQRTLFFATLSRNGKSASRRISIPLPIDVATHAEGMPKVAFKNDGSIIAAYEKNAPTKQNKYASAIYYVMSNDSGISWSKERFLHSDTTGGKSRSYFDIERLPDGEIGASWLDVKLNNETGGRSVRFAKTSPDKGFSNEVLIDSSACQCCRIDVYSDKSENIFIAYRGLVKGSVGRQIRDMMIATSTDYGVTFSFPVTISADNWNIDGCPHTGASLCSNKAGLISLWYTEGSGAGIYYAEKRENDLLFSPRQQISHNGRHPQLNSNEHRIAMLWEENTENDGDLKTVIHYRISASGMSGETQTLTPATVNAFLPVVAPMGDGFLTAFLMERNGHTGVYLRKI